jgi:hypothetical protein
LRWIYHGRNLKEARQDVTTWLAKWGKVRETEWQASFASAGRCFRFALNQGAIAALQSLDIAPRRQVHKTWPSANGASARTEISLNAVTTTEWFTRIKHKGDRIQLNTAG